VGLWGDVGELVKLPISPHRVHQCDDGRLLVVDVEGGLTLVSQELEDMEPTEFPFPTPITHSILCEQQFIGYWIDHELLTARLAAFRIDENIESGISRAELRTSMTNRGNHHVHGTQWSHAMDAEMMQMCENDGVICFALWKRGIYAIKRDGTEVWRREPLKWSEISELPRALEIVAIEVVDGSFCILSRGGGWAMISRDSGNTVEMGMLDSPQLIDRAFYNSESGWLLVSGNEVMMLSHLQGEVTTAVFQGPVNHATWDEEKSVWRVTGWRQDAILGTDVEFSARSDIGIHVGNYRREWYVLDNSGTWSKHLQ
jgi:hypothetical protein